MALVQIEATVVVVDVVAGTTNNTSASTASIIETSTNSNPISRIRCDYSLFRTQSLCDLWVCSFLNVCIYLELELAWVVFFTGLENYRPHNNAQASLHQLLK